MQNKGSNFKWFVCFLLFLITAINYMDRQVIGLLKGTLSEQFQWDEYDFSYIIMGFQCAYAVGSFLMGYLIDKVGVRKGFVIVAFFWSVATAAHALASSVLGFLLARIMLGLFEGGNFPAAVRAVSTNFPKSERALANGLFNSGSNVGAIVAPLLIPLIAAFHSWQASFVTLGLLGLVWIAIWYFSYGEKPAANFADEAEEEQVEPQKKVSWLKLLTHGSSWAYIVGMAMSGPIWWFYLFWTPNFLEKNYNASLSDIAAPLALIYSIACVGSVGGGWISSELIKRGKSVNFSRKIALLICACCVCPVAFAQSAPDMWIAASLIGLAGAAHQGFSANLFAMASDVAPKNLVASLTGCGTAFSSATSFVLSLTIAHIVSITGSYETIFYGASVSYLVALVIIHILSPKLKPISID